MNYNVAERDKDRSGCGLIVVIALLVGLAILAVIGFRNWFVERIDEIPEIYTSEEFEEAIASGSGDYLVCGTMTVENPVTSSEIGGEYIYLTEETLVQTLKRTGLNSSRYVWEATDVETQTCDSIVLLGIEIPVSAFASAASSNQIDTVEATSNTKYCFYGFESVDGGTLDVTISDGEIVSVNGVYSNMEPAEVKEELKDDEGVLSLIAIPTMVLFFMIAFVMIPPFMRLVDW